MRKYKFKNNKSKKKENKKYSKKGTAKGPDYMLTEGILMRHKRGFGFVTPIYGEEEEEENESGRKSEQADIFISAKNLKGAMNGDKVSVALYPTKRGSRSREGFIEKVIVRNTDKVIGKFEKNKRFGFVVPIDKKMNNDDIFIEKGKWKNAQDGDFVVARILKYAEKGSSAEGEITEIVSRKDEAGGDIKAVARQYNLYETFPSRVNAEAKAVSKIKDMKKPDFQLVSEAEIKGRTDLRKEKIITIDGQDSKDLDDAVSISKNENGNFILGVHIADVSHYVAEDGYMDKEAFKRGNSVYLINQVIPMLPKSLSNGICSLNEGVDRLALSVSMEIDGEGKVVSHDIYPSIINSSHRMIYDDVSDMIECPDAPKTAILKEKYKNIQNMLAEMNELASILRKRRQKKGSIDFDFDEAYIKLDEDGVPVSVSIEDRRVANRIIEEFMLIANQTVAEHFSLMEVPFVYRIHDEPDGEKTEVFRNFIKGFGLSMGTRTEKLYPGDFSRILEKIKGKAYENVVSTIMLRTMSKAFYHTECQGHFGLGFKYYCHFTSPIRRYPDLVIHRIIKEAISKGLTPERVRELELKTALASEQSSKTERLAQEIEREVEKMKKAEYMAAHIMEEFEGVISGVTSFGFFVELKNTVEGFVRIDSIKGDFYVFEPEKYRLMGQGSRKTYALGDKINVRVIRASAEDREIDFEIVQTTVKDLTDM